MKRGITLESIRLRYSLSHLLLHESLRRKPSLKIFKIRARRLQENEKEG